MVPPKTYTNKIKPYNLSHLMHLIVLKQSRHLAVRYQFRQPTTTDGGRHVCLFGVRNGARSVPCSKTVLESSTKTISKSFVISDFGVWYWFGVRTRVGAQNHAPKSFVISGPGPEITKRSPYSTPMRSPNWNLMLTGVPNSNGDYEAFRERTPASRVSLFFENVLQIIFFDVSGLENYF